MAYLDAHVHVFAKASAEFPREVSADLPAEAEATVEQLLGQMEAHEVDQAVLVQIGGTSIAHHAYLRYCLREYPRRFLGIGLVPPEEPDPAQHMDRLAGEGGIVGFRLFTLGGPADPLAPMDVRTFSTYPIWKRAAEKDYVLWLYPRAADAHLVPFLLEAFPQVQVVFNHLMVCPGEGSFSLDEKGRPRIEVPMPPLTRYSTMGLKIGRILANTRGLHPYENVCVHLSGQYAFSKEGWPYLDLAGWHASLHMVMRADRLMWASDFPWIVEDPGYENLVGLVDELLPGLSAEERVQIMGGTARDFLRFPRLSER
ncbi:MAG: amidohydrolase [Candidatus Latescibacteria bacterium]|nr:amidohydrolase [Candidatus Latescibacterota bacterium]